MFLIDNSSPPPRFYVSDNSSDLGIDYTAAVTLISSHNLHSGNAAARGNAVDWFGDRRWVIDNDDNVYVYDLAGASLGFWHANDARYPEGIASNGDDIWIVDRGGDRVYFYDDAATVTSGSLDADSSFALDGNNRTPRGMTTDGTSLWVVNDAAQDSVFRYDLNGNLYGSWIIDPSNRAPRGITIDPTTMDNVWVVDGAKDKIYEYSGATNLATGDKQADAEFDLDSTNPSAQGLARSASFPPRVALLRAGDNPTVESTVDFDLVFTHDVINIDPTDFDIVTTGSATGSIASVTDGVDTDPATFRLTVDQIAGEGTLSVAVSATSDIASTAGSELHSPPLVDEIYTVAAQDTTPPTVAFTRADDDPTSADSVVFDVILSEPVFGVDAGDFLPTVSGTVVGTIGQLSGTGAVYSLVIDALAGDGTFGLVVAGGNGIADAAG